MHRYTLSKSLIACRATTFAKVDYSDNQSIVGAFCKRPLYGFSPSGKSARAEYVGGYT
ncbi:hypothetical protein HMPREF9073_01918 [Capnocytophaga sp. oral taxon 326 str. F0382]|nr:hypothetical protein HMPREF9073_01918 [Capnocytophaga sp. oral taxon 326 str. F0382]